MDELSMIVCDTCGSVVHPSCLQLHSDWHDSLLTDRNLEDWAGLDAKVANPERTKR